MAGPAAVWAGWGSPASRLEVFAPPINRLITELARFPGIGQRTAQRLAFHILRASDEEALALADAIREVKEKVGQCEVCFNLATEATCRICQDDRRDAHVICVVEEPSDVIPIERTNEFSGKYHVLGGALSPIDGVDPEDLHMAELLRARGAERRARGGGGHQRHHHRRGHRHVHRRRAAPARAAGVGHAAGQRPARWAPTWNTPMRSRWAARCAAVASSSLLADDLAARVHRCAAGRGAVRVRGRHRRRGRPGQAGPALRFGIGPLPQAGQIGPAPGAAVPEQPARTDAALASLRPPTGSFTLRLNRFFWSDGEAGIRRYLALAERFTSQGYLVELQVRYHPGPGQEGDIGAWTRHVREVVRRFGANPRVVALQIANEVNFNISPDSSDGSYAGARDALVQGVIAAKDEALAGGPARPGHRLQLGLPPGPGQRGELLELAARQGRRAVRARRGLDRARRLPGHRVPAGGVARWRARRHGQRDELAALLRAHPRHPGVGADEGGGERLAHLPRALGGDAGAGAAGPWSAPCTTSAAPTT